MTGIDLSKEKLSDLTNEQLENVAEIVAHDCTLTDSWRKLIADYVRGKELRLENMQQFVDECVSSVANDIENGGYYRIWEKRLKKLLRVKRKQGRLLGEGRGAGAVQKFIRSRGGKRYLSKMYKEYRSANAVADYIYRRYGFYCCGNSVRNMLRHYRIPRNPSGGDRRSPAHVQFRKHRNKS